jgi:dolichyl-phosphate-mannose--protein O-mannosyl transferase
MTQEKKENIKRWLVSSLLTFLAAFAATFATELKSISLDGLETSVIVGVVFTAVRAGFKALVEFLPLLFAKK